MAHKIYAAWTYRPAITLLSIFAVLPLAACSAGAENMTAASGVPSTTSGSAVQDTPSSSPSPLLASDTGEDRLAYGIGEPVEFWQDFPALSSDPLLAAVAKAGTATLTSVKNGYVCPTGKSYAELGLVNDNIIALTFTIEAVAMPDIVSEPTHPEMFAPNVGKFFEVAGPVQNTRSYTPSADIAGCTGVDHGDFFDSWFFLPWGTVSEVTVLTDAPASTTYLRPDAMFAPGFPAEPNLFWRLD